MKALEYHSSASLPNVELWLQDDDGTLVDFSSGYTFSLKIGAKGAAAVLTKSSGITGAAGSGSEPDGTANVTIAWSDGELANIDPGPYTWQLTCTATSGGKDRVFEGQIKILDVIT